MLLLAALCDLPAQLLTGCFLDGGRNLFSLLDRLGLFDGLGNLFRDCFTVAVRKDFTEPAAHVLDDLSQALHRSEASQARGPCLTHGADCPKILAHGGRWRLVAVRKHFFQPFLGDETELGQAIAEGLQFDSGLACVRVGDAACEQVGVIGEDVDALTATGNGNVKLLAVDGGKTILRTRPAKLHPRSCSVTNAT